MVIWLYSIFDSKAKAFATPFFCSNDDVSVRMFARSVKDPQSMMFSNPEDFSLYRLGSFNHESGRLIMSDPVFMCEATGRGREGVDAPAAREGFSLAARAIAHEDEHGREA